MNKHEKINYIEFPAINLEKTKAFFTQVFDWRFQDFGPDYTAFSDEGLDGGFFKSDTKSSTKNGAALLVFYSNDINSTLDKIKKANGTIITDTYSFPGGHRFHFTEPSGNEFSVWSDK